MDCRAARKLRAWASVFRAGRSAGERDDRQPPLVLGPLTHGAVLPGPVVFVDDGAGFLERLESCAVRARQEWVRYPASSSSPTGRFRCRRFRAASVLSMKPTSLRTNAPTRHGTSSPRRAGQTAQ
jgi:hypothetical protein